MLSKVKGVIAGVLVVAVLGMLLAAFWHYQRTVAANGELSARASTLEAAVTTQASTIGALREAVTEWEQHSREMSRRMDALIVLGEEAQAETRRLNALFRDHDIGALGAARPGLIESRLNAGTDRARCLLEQASGAPRRDC